jgi:hypothetical protein
MNARRRLGVSVLALGCVVAAGAVAIGADPQDTRPAADVVQAGLSSIDAAPHRLAIAGSAKATLRRTGSQLGLTISDDLSARVEVEGPTRSKWYISETFALKEIPVVIYDGQAFFAKKGGSFERVAGDDATVAKLMFEPAGQRLRPTKVTDLDGLVELAPEQRSGVNARHFKGTVRPEFLGETVDRLISSAGIPNADAASARSSAVPATGQIDIWTDAASGVLVDETVVLRAEVDLKKLVKQSLRFGDGGFGVDTLSLEAQLNYHPSEIGVPIVVTRPVARLADAILPSQNAAADAAAKSLIRNAQSTIETVYIDERTYRVTPQVLRSVEPNIRFSRTGPARAARNEVRTSNLSANGYMLSTLSASGRTFSIVRKVDGQSVRICRIGKTSCGRW